MVYKDLTRKDFLDGLGLPEQKVPQLLIIEGNWRFEERLRVFEKLVKKRFECKWAFVNRFCRFGFVKKTPVVFSCVYGSALASEMVHVFSVLGAKAVIQVGSFGGLQRGMKIGDFLLPTWTRTDAVFQYYPHSGKADSSFLLRKHIKQGCVAKKFRVFEKPLFSASAMLGETRKIIRNWSAKGFFGVDMETAATFSVAKHFGVPAASLLYLSDQVIEDKHLLMGLAFEDKKRKIRAKKNLLPIVLNAGLNFLNAKD